MIKAFHTKIKGKGTFKNADWQALSHYFKNKYDAWNLREVRSSANPNNITEYARIHWNTHKEKGMGFGDFMIQNADQNWTSFKIHFESKYDEKACIKVEIDCKEKSLELIGSLKDKETLRTALEGIKSKFNLVNDFDLLEYTDGKTVFVIHGRNMEVKNEVFKFLRGIGLNPLEWNQAIAKTKKGSPYTGEILDEVFSQAQAVLALFTPDEIVELKSEFIKPDDPSYEREPSQQSRPNVIFEAGMALGRNPDRTILLEFGKLRPFSDIAGRHIIRMDSSQRKKKDLISRLEAVGCEIKLEGDQWLKERDF